MGSILPCFRLKPRTDNKHIHGAKCFTNLLAKTFLLSIGTKNQQSICVKHFLGGTGSISLFFTPKKTPKRTPPPQKKLRRAQSWKNMTTAPTGRWWCARCSPPANPTPFPLPSKAPTFWGFGQWGRVGGEGGLELLLPLVRDLEWGTDCPPSTLLPLAQFLRGAPRERGLREALQSLDLPCPPPRRLASTSAPGVHVRSWRGIDMLGSGSKVETPQKKYHLSNPSNAPVPTRTTDLGRGSGGGGGLGAQLEPSLPQPHPRSHQGAPPLLGCEGGRSARQLGGSRVGLV